MDEFQASDSKSNAERRTRTGAYRKRRRRLLLAGAWSVGLALIVLAAIAWLGIKASAISSELEAAEQLVPELRAHLVHDRPGDASAAAKRLKEHTSSARGAAEDPVWTMAAALPLLGANFSAVTEVARSADDVASLGVIPLVKVFDSLNWDSLLPTSAGSNLAPIQAAAPSVSTAAHAVRTSADRLATIESSNLLPQVAEPVARAREKLEAVTGAMDLSANVARIAPEMLGAEGPRNYLLMIQNNAEARASGGIPGALAVLTFDNGRLKLSGQSSASKMGAFSPGLKVDAEQQRIYTARLGKFVQDVNLTPDFPTAASTAQAMWQRKTGQRVDGVVSLDPVALSYILDATGPVKITKPEIAALTNGGLPSELNDKNVVKTLLSDVYAKIEQPDLQDAYFAGVAQEIFAALSSGQGDAHGLLAGVTRATAEGRILVWSGSANEQAVLKKYPLSGSIAGPSVSPAQFGVYFNDGTGAKMDYYVKRTVQLVKECTNDGYVQIKVRVTSTNTAPKDAAETLPEYVTGGGAFGVPAGSVQTNVVAYGPVQSNVETVSVAGRKTGFASHRHGGRPVGSVTVRLAPGHRSTVEFTFDKIVQHTEPKLSVTPSVQALGDVVLDTVSEKCVPAP